MIGLISLNFTISYAEFFFYIPRDIFVFLVLWHILIWTEKAFLIGELQMLQYCGVSSQQAAWKHHCWLWWSFVFTSHGPQISRQIQTEMWYCVTAAWRRRDKVKHIWGNRNKSNKTVYSPLALSSLIRAIYHSMIRHLNFYLVWHRTPGYGPILPNISYYQTWLDPP